MREDPRPAQNRLGRKCKMRNRAIQSKPLAYDRAWFEAFASGFYEAGSAPASFFGLTVMEPNLDTVDEVEVFAHGPQLFFCPKVIGNTTLHPERRWS